MNVYRKLISGAFAATVLAVLIPTAQARGLQESMKITFSGPVELPGVVLPAGTYIFEALESGRLTRILSADEERIWATLLTVPVERTERTANATVILAESLNKSPERVEEWFYPGDSVGSEFIYQKSPSKKNVSSLIEASGKGAERIAAKTARDVAGCSEFLAVKADHVVVRPIVHVLKVLV